MLREPHLGQQTNVPSRAVKEAKRRFQIIKLEERVAPSNTGSNGNGKGCDTNRTCFKC